MRKLLLPDVLGAIVAPLLPPEPPKPRGGRPRVPDRACLTGIRFVRESGIPWEYLAVEMGCGSGVPCWRRLPGATWAWQQAGVGDRLHRTLLDRLGDADRIDRERAGLDSASVPAKRGRRGRTEPERSRQPRHQTAPDHRSPGYSAGQPRCRPPDRGQPP